MRRWSDQWRALFRVEGSVLPRCVLCMSLSALTAWGYWELIARRDPASKSWLTNPTVYGFFMQTAGIILAFTTSICYNRYWEALGCLYDMSVYARTVGCMILTFDRGTTSSDDAWKARTIHTLSILHGICIQSLRSAESDEPLSPLEVLGGMSEEEMQLLRDCDDPTSLSHFWVSDLLSGRSSSGGLAIANPPAVAQVWGQLASFMRAYGTAMKIAKHRLPLSFHQALAWSDLAVALLTPFCITLFAPHVAVAVSVSALTTGVFHALYLSNIVMQQPFGDKTSDLPLTVTHQAFIRGLLSMLSMPVAMELTKLYESHLTSQEDTLHSLVPVVLQVDTAPATPVAPRPSHTNDRVNRLKSLVTQQDTVLVLNHRPGASPQVLAANVLY